MPFLCGTGRAPRFSPRRSSGLVSVDLDLRRFGLRLLVDRYLEHAIVVDGLDLVVARVVGQFERPLNLSVAAFRDPDRCLLWPFRARTFRLDDQVTVLNPRIAYGRL